METNDRNKNFLNTSISIRQLARRWGVGVSRVRSLIQNGVIPAFTVPSSGRFGKAMRIFAKDVEAIEHEWSVHTFEAKRRPRIRSGTKKSEMLDHFPELEGDSDFND